MNIELKDDLLLHAQKASMILGYKSVDDYILNIIQKYSASVIHKYENPITLSDDSFDIFIHACMENNTPNKKLEKALEKTKKKNINK